MNLQWKGLGLVSLRRLVDERHRAGGQPHESHALCDNQPASTAVRPAADPAAVDSRRMKFEESNLPTFPETVKTSRIPVAQAQ